MLSSKSKIKPKPTFSKLKIENPQEDFATATDHGPIQVGDKAVYFTDFDVNYIPLSELSTIELVLLPGACNRGSCCTHDVYFTTHAGKRVNIKVIDAKKAVNAIEHVLKLSPSITSKIPPLN